MITPEELLYIKIILPVILFIWVNIMLVAVTDNLLINAKINGPYHTYILAIEDEQKHIKEQNDTDKGKENNNDNPNDHVNNNNEIVNNNSNSVFFDNNNNNSNNNKSNEQNNDLNNQNNNLNDNINDNDDEIDVDLSSSSNEQDNNTNIISTDQNCDIGLNNNNLENNNNSFEASKFNMRGSIKMFLNTNKMNENLKSNEEVKY